MTRFTDRVTRDLHQIAEDRFIAEIVADLEADCARGAITAIVIAAPPVALGRMRPGIKGNLLQRVVAWIDKDFTGHPVPAITEAIVRALED